MKSFSPLTLLSILSFAASIPHEAPEKRQNSDFSQLLELASLAGIPIPTNDPALLLSIAPIAASLNSLLPTSSVLSVLETAAPTGLLSSLVHDPSFAASWIQSFEEGPSPSWFLALPTDVRSYLHTYADGGNIVGVATAAAGIQSIENSVSSQMSASSASAASVNATITTSTTSIASNGSTSGVAGGTTSMATTSSTVSTSLSTAGAARETGALAVGAVAMAGILGLAVAL